jgi:hypothetical protein
LYCAGISTNEGPAFTESKSINLSLSCLGNSLLLATALLIKKPALNTEFEQFFRQFRQFRQEVAGFW